MSPGKPHLASKAPQLPPETSRHTRTAVDYLTLNDGLEDDEVSSPRHKKKPTYRPGSGPSATRQAAIKHTISPEAKTTDNQQPTVGLSVVPPLPAVPSMRQGAQDQSIKSLTGVPVNKDEQLPDLVLPSNDPAASQATGAVSTEEEMDAAETLLSLGEARDNTLDDDNENAMLMPIGGPNTAVDVAPEPLRLDQVNVDKAIAELIQNNQNNEDDQTDLADKTENKTPTADVDHDNVADVEPKSAVKEGEPTTRGKLKTKNVCAEEKSGN